VPCIFTKIDYLFVCYQEAFLAFQDVIQRLCKDVIDTPQCNGSTVSLPHVAVLRSDFKFLQASQAEGLLGVCVFLIKVSILVVQFCNC